MDLSDKDIEEFRQAWRRDFGELLAEGEACYQASRLLDFLLMLSQPLPGEKRDEKQTEQY